MAWDVKMMQTNAALGRALGALGNGSHAYSSQAGEWRFMHTSAEPTGGSQQVDENQFRLSSRSFQWCAVLP